MVGAFIKTARGPQGHWLAQPTKLIDTVPLNFRGVVDAADAAQNRSRKRKTVKRAA